MFLIQKILFSLLILCTSATSILANDNVAHQINLPIVDIPENQSFDYINPGMTQSLQLSKSFYQFSHYSMQKFWDEKNTETLISIILFDTFATWLPLSNSWLHEEWHRNVLNQYDISSHNGIYDYDWFSEVIAVDHVKDEDLSKLKKNHPQDFIRLHTAGLEAQSMLNLSLEMDKFFNETRSFDYMLLWFNSINSLAYLDACSTNESNRITSEILSKENQDISNRDFTGMDCNAWVYDLFHPDEDYADRGIHPSGTGINRYITLDKLSTSEKNFLRKQYYLYFLNFADPFLLSMDNFRLPDYLAPQDILWNTNLQHFINPFGYSVNWNVFARNAQYKTLFSLKNYFNKHHYFAGLAASIVDKPVLANKTLISLSGIIWQQPKGLSFTTSQGEWGGQIAAGIKYPVSKYITLYSNASYKTQGWLEGYVHLDNSFYFLAGILVNRFE